MATRPIYLIPRGCYNPPERGMRESSLHAKVIGGLDVALMGRGT